MNGSFVFVHEGSQSRDKFMSSGQNLAVKGTTVGYYLFRRCEVNRREVGTRGRRSWHSTPRWKKWRPRKRPTRRLPKRLAEHVVV